MPRYSTTLLDHARAPRNAGELATANAVGRSSRNDTAPNTVVFLRVEDDYVREAGFQAFGCGVTIAACSVLTALVTGRELDECRSIRAHDVIAALDGMPADKQFCADLAVAALRDALHNWHHGQITESSSSS